MVFKRLCFKNKFIVLNDSHMRDSPGRMEFVV